MNESYSNNNQFPQNNIVATLFDKREIVRKIGNEIVVDEGIMDIVEEVNKTPLLLTESSCQGSDGNPNSTHFDTAYITIGVLYNQNILLEEIAKILKRRFRDSISCSFNSQVNYVLDDQPIYRFFIRINILNKDIFGELKCIIEQFGNEKMPAIEIIEKEDEALIQTEVEISKTWGAFLNQIQFKDTKSIEDEKSKISVILNSPQKFRNVSLKNEPARNGFPEAVNVSFEYNTTLNIEHLFRPLTSTFGTDIKCFCRVEMDKHRNFSRVVDIYLFNIERIQILRILLMKWSETQNGILI